MTPEEEQQLREVLVSGLHGGEEDLLDPENASLLTIATVLAATTRMYRRSLMRLSERGIIVSMKEDE